MNYCATELSKMSNAVVVTSSYYNNNHHPQQNHYSFNNSSINNSSNSNNNNNNISTPSSSTSINNNTMTDDLPKQFVSSLRILFDILDENHSGFVRLSDIESRWKEDGVKGLPSGVVDALKKVTPANGYLNFDRFVSGLKLVLWRTKHNMVGSGSSSDAGISSFPLFQFPEQQSDEFQQSKENKFVYHIDDDDDDDDDIKPNNGHHLVSTQPQFNNLSDHIIPTNPHQQFTTSMKQSTNSAADVFSGASFTIPSGTNHPYGSLNRPNYPPNNFGFQNNINYSTCSNSSTSTVTDSGHHFRNSSSSNNIINTHDVSRSFNDTIHPSSGLSSVPGDKMTPQIQQQQRLPYVTRCPERPPLQPRQPVVIHPHSHPYSNNNNTHLQDMPVPDASGESMAPLPPPPIHPQPFSPPQLPPRDQNKVNILNELKNWQRQQRMKNLTTTTTDSLNVRRGSEWGSGVNRNPPMTDNIITKDTDRNTYVNIDNFQQRRNQEEYATKKSADLRHSNRRWDGRRHTLTSGVDHSMIKRMRQLEEEKEMLEQGMEVLESARLWYQKQLASIHDKQKVAAWSSFNDSSLEASQERMNFQRTRISEVNQQLKTLIESSERGFPLHMNLAIGSAGHPLILEDNCAKMLKEQNRQLTEEISSKCDKITQLEQEKTALIRELFESRSRSKTSLDDTTFM